MAAHHPAPFSKHFYTLTQHKAMANSLQFVSLQTQREKKKNRALKAEAWIAASAAPWRPCTGFQGTPSVLPAMKVPRPSSPY
uniref:Uncharacterized protein n=1 Tax=Arundo donax TaxID=35708 RepID=A0A0A9H7F8_ARUDO